MVERTLVRFHEVVIWQMWRFSPALANAIWARPFLASPFGAALGCRGFTRQPENSKRNSGPRPSKTPLKFTKRPQEKLWREREEKARHFGPLHPSGQHPSGLPPLHGLHFSEGPGASKRHHNSTKGPQERKKENCGGRGKKRAKNLCGPAQGCPEEEGPGGPGERPNRHTTHHNSGSG